MSRNFSRALGLLALVAALLFAGTPALVNARADGGSGEDGYVTNEINVKLLRASDLQAVAQQFKLELIEQFGARPIYRMRVTDGTDAKVKATAVAADTSRVEYAEANYTAGAPEGSGLTWSVASSWTSGLTWSVGGGGPSGKDDYLGQWGAVKIRLSDAHRATKGAGIIVAVLDTGVDRRHPALAGRLLRGRDFVDDDDDPSEVLPTCPPGSANTDPRNCGPYGHGTHVAGLVALTAPEARIMPLRVLDAQGVGNMWVVAEALRYALDPDGDPSTDDGADVINMSLATFQDSRVLREVVGDACDTGVASPYSKVVVVAAAGNHGTTTKMYPAAENFDGELSVAASQADDTLAPFSQRDDRVVNDVMSPGVGVTSSVPGSGTGAWSGTSMAAPIVAGLAALVRAASPDLSADLVKDRIRGTSDRPVPEQPVKRRINASAAVVPFVNFQLNPVDNTGNFVRQQYLDFLNRAPDKTGGDFWSHEVEQCGTDAACAQFRRTNTSGAFFLSIEFRDTGYFVYRLNKAAFGNLAADKPVPVRYEDFMPDTQRIGEGVVVNSPGWEQKLFANRDAFVLEFVSRPRFVSAYPTTLTPEQFVDQLFANAGVTPSAPERQAVISQFGGAATSTDAASRVKALKLVAENAALVAGERNRAFVLMQYFGYLRRNPDDAPEEKRDFSGFNFWLSKLEGKGGDFIASEMVRAFIESIEYRGRFRQ
jgi:thermitase